MHIKLIYFDMPFWRAEVARLPLFLSNIEFEDFRITSDDNRYLKEHGALRDGTSIPFRQLPVLVLEGQSIAQTGAIARICGKVSGMYPEDMIEAGRVDQIIDTVTDINELLNPSMRENDPAIKKQMRIELSNGALTQYFGYLEELLKSNNSGWFVGNEMTIADIAVWSMLGWIAQGVLDDIPKDLSKPFKRLTHLYNDISKQPDVREWKKMTYACEKSSTGEYNYHVPDSI
jgi:prostaglandin-H2 D-isomerase / glutathione transferase